ncbi:class I SAM-dependent methyltransferase [Megalodesulfovibrio paquesii]
MPTIEWLKQEFDYGYDSGDILALRPDACRANEERRCGGSYFNYFNKAVKPLLRPDAQVLELGPGRGSWTRALLAQLPEGSLHTCDFQDATPWLKPDQYGGRLQCHQVEDNTFSCVADEQFDLFFSFGVLCHCNTSTIRTILEHALRKVKPGGHAIHNYGAWEKLGAWGFARGGVPEEFSTQPDDAIWWPRNTVNIMASLCRDAGWTVLCDDLQYFQRDGVILLRRDA